MIQDQVGSELDLRQLDATSMPAYRVVLFSRWLDSDSDIVNGTTRQTPIDITRDVEDYTLTLAGARDASTFSARISLQRLPPDLFFNCIVQLQEGVEEVDPLNWPITFTGIHQGQPQATEAVTQDQRPESTSVGPRGQARRLTITFASRSVVYRNQRLTSPGLWLPVGPKKNDDLQFQFRDAYDDVGSIAREVATSSWGMGLTGGEVLLGQLAFRIENQLQIFDEDLLTAMTQLLQPLHLKPVFNGRGQLTAFSEDVNKATVRNYDRTRTISIPMQQRNQAPTNSVKVVGLDSEITEIIHADQVLKRIQGTFGYFDGEMTFKGTWGDDETESFRVKVGTVFDGDGVLVESARIVNFEQEGLIIEPISAPRFTILTEFEWEVEIKNDAALIALLIASFLAGYVALAQLTTLLAEIDGGAGGDIPNPAAIAAEIASAALLFGAITVLQQIGNFSFEIHGVPFETVYKELPVEANLGHFAAFDATGATIAREYERKAEEFENHLFSSIADRTTDNGVVNVGLERWAREQLAVEVARAAPRTVVVPRDILLEPGDAIEVDNMVVQVETIQRDGGRAQNPRMTLTGYQIRKVTAVT